MFAKPSHSGRLTFARYRTSFSDAGERSLPDAFNSLAKTALTDSTGIDIIVDHISIEEHLGASYVFNETSRPGISIVNTTLVDDALNIFLFNANDIPANVVVNLGTMEIISASFDGKNVTLKK